MSEGDGGEHGVRAVRQAMVMTRQASGGGRLEPGGTAAAGDISMVNAAANPLLFMQSRQWHLLILSCLRANSPSTISLAESNTLFFSSHRYLANQIPPPLVFFAEGVRFPSLFVCPSATCLTAPPLPPITPPAFRSLPRLEPAKSDGAEACRSGARSAARSKAQLKGSGWSGGARSRWREGSWGVGGPGSCWIIR